MICFKTAKEVYATAVVLGLRTAIRIITAAIIATWSPGTTWSITATAASRCKFIERIFIGKARIVKTTLDEPITIVIVDFDIENLNAVALII